MKLFDEVTHLELMMTSVGEEQIVGYLDLYNCEITCFDTYMTYKGRQVVPVKMREKSGLYCQAHSSRSYVAIEWVPPNAVALRAIKKLMDTSTGPVEIWSYLFYNKYGFQCIDDGLWDIGYNFLHYCSLVKRKISNWFK